MIAHHPQVYVPALKMKCDVVGSRQSPSVVCRKNGYRVVFSQNGVNVYRD